MNQSKNVKFSVFVDLANSVENNRVGKRLLYDLLAKLNTYDHIARIFVLNDPESGNMTNPTDVPSAELYHNSDATKHQYYMFEQENGYSEFFNKVLNIDQNYKLNQANTSDIIYITAQNNTALINLRQIYAVIPNPNVITIKIDTAHPSTTNSVIQEVMDLLSLSRKPLSIRIAKGALSPNVQGKILSYVDKYRTPDKSRVVVVYPSSEKYQEHYVDKAIYNMYLTDPAVDLDERITSVTPTTIARFLAKLLTDKSRAHTPVKSRKGRLVSGIRRFTRKVLGRASSRRKQTRDLDLELPAYKRSSRKSSKKSSKIAKSTIQQKSSNTAEVTEQLRIAAKYAAEVERLDTLIAESGKSRQDKQKTQDSRDKIIDINRKYKTHRTAFIRAIKALFRSGSGSVKSKLYAMYSNSGNPKHKQLLERIIRVLDDKEFISNSMGNTANNYVDVKKVKRAYQDTLRENMAANPGFFKKLTRKRILGRLSAA